MYHNVRHTIKGFLVHLDGRPIEFMHCKICFAEKDIYKSFFKGMDSKS